MVLMTQVVRLVRAPSFVMQNQTKSAKMTDFIHV